MILIGWAFCSRIKVDKTYEVMEMKLPLEKRKMKVVELDEFEDIVLDADEFFDPDEEMSDD